MSSVLHGKVLMTGRSMGLRMIGSSLCALCLYHFFTAGLDTLPHTIGTLVLFLFGAYLAMPETVSTFLHGLAKVLPWGKP